MPITAPLSFLQANINHCACAQDLLLQSMAQWSINIAVVAEPYSVWPRKDWVADLNGSVAIISSAAAGTPTLEGVRGGQGCVAARLREFVVVGVYFSPNRSLAELHNSLAELRAVVVGSYPLPVLVLGDFNAKDLAWGSRHTDVRGRMVEDWALETGLVVLNRGSVPTCVRMRGESVVDISFASPALSPRAIDWRVMEGVETYSDHRYIRFDVSTQPSSAPVQQAPSGPRWALKQLDRELLLEASIVQAWVSSPDRPADVNDEAAWFQEAMSEICDVAMPRVQPGSARRQVYWWSRPDGLLGKAWVLASEALGPRLEGLLSACLERGQFPLRWKTGKLVLIRKPGRPADSPSAYRPVVLLDEVGKLFERVIANRLAEHLAGTGPDLAEHQFGFRKRWSTVDAIMCPAILHFCSSSELSFKIDITQNKINVTINVPYAYLQYLIYTRR
ncbi:unnamed protein product [Parnassius mnemosyne]|uniref:Endonuclease/exonuclease/phosphatase domain-containing protein n=1 Tax=Parnassius mnemosyne TaxID=213953 RepID=A0AAV1LZ47_9NEOP